MSIRQYWTALALSVALLAGGIPEAQAAPEKALKQVTSVEGITEYRLANGLKVLLFPDPSKPTVTVNITYQVGSRHEGRGEAGMAHLLEHMVFKGTPTHPNVWGALEDHGARFNGTTWVDRTNYYETLPATDKNLEFALALEADRMIHCDIDPEVLATEMTVVRNEFEMGENNPVGVLEERMMSSAYLWHNYGKSTIGNRSDIERVPAENLRGFYEKYYQPDNAMLVVAGAFEPARVLELVKQHFGPIPRPERLLEATYTEEPVQDGPRLVTLSRVGDVAAAGLVYHMPAGSHPDFPAVQLLTQVLTNEPSGRLYKALVETGKATSIRGYSFAWAEPGVTILTAQTRIEQDPAALLDEMIAVTEGLGTGSISDAEVERVKNRALKRIKLSLTNSGRIGVQLSEWEALGDWRMFFLHRDRLKAVTTADVVRVAKSYLVESNRTAGLFTPSKEPVRAPALDKPDVQALVANYQGTETIQQGEAFEATPANVEKRTHRSEPRKGMKLALLPKQTRGDAVEARLRFQFGTENTLTGHTATFEILPEMLMRGTTKRSFQELSDSIDGSQSRIRVYGGVGSFGASIESDREHFLEALALVAEIVKEPRLDPDELEVLRKERLAQAEESLSDPRARAFTWIHWSLNPWPASSIHYVPTIEEEIERLEAVRLEDLKTLHERYYGADQLQVAVVGDFDENEVAAKLEELFGSWTSGARYQRIAKPHRAIKPQTKAIDTPDKKMAMVGMASPFALRDDDPDYPAVRFAAYILGSSSKARLVERLRQKEGLSYGAWGFVAADSEDERARLSTMAICASQNAGRAQQAMDEEIRLWLADGVTDTELREGKASYALKFQNDLSNNGRVAGMLAEGLELDRTMVYYAKLLEEIDRLEQADIQKALDKHLGSAPFVAVKAGNLKAAEQEAVASAGK